MKYLTAGNSHGKCLIGILSGLPYGIKISEEYLKMQLDGRKTVPGRGIRQNTESDRFEVISGISEGVTDANPVGIIIYNKKNDLKKFSYFTPGYGDLFGAIKYSHKNTYIVKERASARETAARVLLFSFTKRFTELLGIEMEYRVLKCYRENDFQKFNQITDEFREKGDSFGGIFELKIKNVPIGIGGYSEPDERLQSRISRAIFSISSVKAVEFGKGFEITDYKATEINSNTEMLGGIECGMTDGNDIVIKCATRPLSSVKYTQKTADIKTGEKINLSISTSDITSVFAAAYISQYTVSYVIADEIMKKFGSDNFNEIYENVKKWRKKTEKIIKNIKK